MREQVVIALTKTHSQKQIAEALGVDRKAVRDIQRKYHLVLSFGQSQSSALFTHRWDEHKWGRILEEMYINQELPMREIAKRCHLDKETVRRRLVHLGFGIRSAADNARLRAGKRR